MLLDKSIAELRKGLLSKEFSAKEIIEESYNQIARYDQQLNSLVNLVARQAVLGQVQTLEQNSAWLKLPLAGIPFVLKDSYVTREVKTTAGSKILQDFVSPYDATVYQKLVRAGAVLIGKASMDAWGHGASTENTDFGPCHNPWDLARVAGGSSGGPAAAISSRLVSFGIGEDTGGSIRNPAAWTGITGLKVSYGRVSRYGCIAYASSFDTVGPMAKTAQDCAYVLEAIAGKDKYDATSSPAPVPAYSQTLEDEVKGLVIGLPQEFFSHDLNKEITQTILEAVKVFEKLGVKIKKISMPALEYGVAVYYLIAPSETSSNLGRYDGIRYGLDRSHFTEETVRRILTGTYALSAGYYDAYYKKAQQARTVFIQEYAKAFEQCDVLLMPVNPTPPPRIGELVNDPIQNMLADVFTVTQNPVGVPSLAIPCGFDKAGLPIGMQLTGRMFSEDLLLRLGHQYQRLTEWHKMSPKLISR